MLLGLFTSGIQALIFATLQLILGVSKTLSKPMTLSQHQHRPTKSKSTFRGQSPFRCRCGVVTGLRNPKSLSRTEPIPSSDFNFFLSKMMSYGMGVIKKKKKGKTVRFRLGFQIHKV